MLQVSCGLKRLSCGLVGAAGETTTILLSSCAGRIAACGSRPSRSRQATQIARQEQLARLLIPLRTSGAGRIAACGSRPTQSRLGPGQDQVRSWAPGLRTVSACIGGSRPSRLGPGQAEDQTRSWAPGQRTVAACIEGWPYQKMVWLVGGIQRASLLWLRSHLRVELNTWLVSEELGSSRLHTGKESRA